MKLEEHPTVKWFRQHAASRAPAGGKLEAAWLRQLCLDCGADDAGLVEISRSLDDQRDDILRYFPPARTLLSFVCRMNRQPSGEGAEPALGPRAPETTPHGFSQAALGLCEVLSKVNAGTKQ